MKITSPDLRAGAYFDSTRSIATNIDLAGHTRTTGPKTIMTTRRAFGSASRQGELRFKTVSPLICTSDDASFPSRDTGACSTGGCHTCYSCCDDWTNADNSCAKRACC